MFPLLGNESRLRDGEEVARLIDDVLALWPRAASSPLRGQGHWQRVGFAGAKLAEKTRGADALLVFLFALFHDTCRIHDGHDPDHGPRAAHFASELLGGRGLLSEKRLGTLTFACEHHDAGEVSGDRTVGVCWDADRLTLWRLGIRPDRCLLSTPAARNPAIIAWASSLETRRYTWQKVLTLYGYGGVGA